MEHEHEPWLHADTGNPRTIGVFTQARICKHCGVLYVEPARQAEIDRNEKESRDRHEARVRLQLAGGKKGRA